jgi:23S rRNA (cytidine2498-2'-O)-methyltransferase
VCDVIAYPDRLLSLAQRWIGAARRIVCTIKFEGETDHAAAEAFAALPGGRVRHLFHSKHELTFFRKKDQGAALDPLGPEAPDPHSFPD